MKTLWVCFLILPALSLDEQQLLQRRFEQQERWQAWQVQQKQQARLGK
jgi:hypothetical protein